MFGKRNLTIEFFVVVDQKLRALEECVIPNLLSAIHLNMSLSSLG